MRCGRRTNLAGLAAIAGGLLFTLWCCGVAVAAESGWPEIGAGQKPWTRWWWLGSGVDEKNLTRELEGFAAAGLGGVEICPIYGAMGYEERDREFLSEKWMAALAHTTREARRLGIEVDLTTGTGWPFGGPWVGPEMASEGLQRVKKSVSGGKDVTLMVPGEIVALRAIAKEDGRLVDLKPFVKSGELKWQSPVGGDWTVLGLAVNSPIQKVKRAAPGGAGNVLDPYSGEAMTRYLARFDEALKGFDAPQPRSHFHDSFEYYGAEWSPGLIDRFRKDHGYDLLDQLPAFLGEGDPDVSSRVRADWRVTLSDMHRDYLAAWHDWANGHGSLTRNQAHGSPGNLLDHYAVADIPETEIFRHVEDAQIPMMGLAASAAHLSGRNKVSAESFTWLGEHFQVTPAALKEAADFLFLGGVNHLFYHGTPYSPDDAPWPGWLFYASTHMGPNGGLWRDLPAFNGYLSRVQSVLQNGRPDSEVLLYFPFDDLADGTAEQLSLFTIHNQNEWLHGTGFHRAAMELWNAGIPHDAVSGRLLESGKVETGRIVLGDVKAKLLVVPGAKLLPVRVLKRMLELADAGATVLFLDGLPEDVPGFGALDDRREEFGKLIKSAQGDRVLVGGELMPVLESRGVLAEPMCGKGLRVVRRVRDDGWDYFVVNRSGGRIDDFVELARPFESAVLLDPAVAGRKGLADVRGKALRLVMDPGESVVIRCFDKTVNDKPFSYQVPDGEALVLGGAWSVRFIEGGPELPADYESDALASWTLRDDPKLKAFSGTARYALPFDLPEVPAGGVMLDLGVVAETCRVTVNGRALGSSFFPPHRFDVSGALKAGENQLEVEVTNLAANRIAELDRRGVQWKRFHEINFVNVDYKPFDASEWAPLPSGLLGPVRLVPVK